MIVILLFLTIDPKQIPPIKVIYKHKPFIILVICGKFDFISDFRIQKYEARFFLATKYVSINQVSMSYAVWIW